MKGQDFQSAHNILARYDAPRVITGNPESEDFRRLLKHFEDIETTNNQIFITNWAKEGEIILQYLQLKNFSLQIKDNAVPTDVEDLLFKAKKIRDLITNTNSLTPLRKDTLEVCSIIMTSLIA